MHDTFRITDFSHATFWMKIAILYMKVLEKNQLKSQLFEKLPNLLAAWHISVENKIPFWNCLITNDMLQMHYRTTKHSDFDSDLVFSPRFPFYILKGTNAKISQRVNYKSSEWKIFKFSLIGNSSFEVRNELLINLR